MRRQSLPRSCKLSCPAPMHDLPLLVNIALALGYALAGGLIARRLGLPTIVGYLVAGMALGPFTPGFQGDQDAIGQMAEFGVILLMFGVGLHFNLSDLWQVRRVAIPGAAIQMAIVAAIGYGAARWWGMPPAGAAILGIALVGREHGRAAARADGPRLARQSRGQGGRRLARGRRPADGRHPRAAAGAGRTLNVRSRGPRPASRSAWPCCSWR